MTSTQYESLVDADLGQDQLGPRDSAEDEDPNNGFVRPAQAETAKDQLKAMFKSSRRPSDNKCIGWIGTDGVYRVIHHLPGPPDEETNYEIYDAKPMSSEMIKAFLDTTPWSQATEDRYRGVDGRAVPQEQWWNPPPGVIPPRRTQNERDEEMRKYREEKAQKEQKIARGELIAEEPIACSSVRSDYDLRPR